MTIPSEGVTDSRREDPLMPFYAWLLVTGLVLFGAALLWRYGFFRLVIEADRTWLSIVIMGLFVLVVGLLGRAAWNLSCSRRALQDLHEGIGDQRSTASTGLVREYLDLMQNDNGGGFGDALHARLVERIHRGHHLGWFVADMLIRLGLIGTVIGFIMMLGTVYQLRQDDIIGFKALLGTMGAGMQVALYTTLSGISASMLLSVYCKIMDRYADNLVADIIGIAARGYAGRTQADGKRTEPLEPLGRSI